MKQFINDCIDVNMGRSTPTIYKWMDVPFAVRFLLSLVRMRMFYRDHTVNSPWHRNSVLSGPNSDSYWEWCSTVEHRIDLTRRYTTYGGYDDN